MSSIRYSSTDQYKNKCKSKSRRILSYFPLHAINTEQQIPTSKEEINETKGKNDPKKAIITKNEPGIDVEKSTKSERKKLQLIDGLQVKKIR